MSNDPVTNALTLQMEMGDDELRKAVEDRIREIALEEIAKYMASMYNPDFVMRYQLDLERLVVRTIYSTFASHPRNY